MLESLLGTAFFGVVWDLPRDAVSRRRDQQAKRKAVASLASNFLLVVATPFLGASFAVAGAVCVLCFPSGLTGKRGVDDDEELSIASFHLQKFHPQERVKVVSLPAGPTEKTRELSTMEGFGGDASSGLRATHSPAVHDKGESHAEHQASANSCSEFFATKVLSAAADSVTMIIVSPSRGW